MARIVENKKNVIKYACIKFKDETEPRFIPTSDVKIKKTMDIKNTDKKSKQRFRLNKKGKKIVYENFEPTKKTEFKKEFWYHARYECPKSLDEMHNHEGYYKCNILLLSSKFLIFLSIIYI